MRQAGDSRERELREAAFEQLAAAAHRTREDLGAILAYMDAGPRQTTDWELRGRVQRLHRAWTEAIEQATRDWRHAY